MLKCLFACFHASVISIFAGAIVPLTAPTQHAAPQELTASSTVLDSSPSPSILGMPVMLTATISPATASGKVTFYDGVEVLGTGTLVGGSATLQTTLLSTGDRYLRAYYQGDTVYAPSSSPVSVATVVTHPSNKFRSPLEFPVLSAPRSVEIGDLNGDGRADLAVTNGGNNSKVSVLLGNGNGTFQQAMNFRTGAEPSAVTIGDFNEDGRADLAVANGGSADVSILLGNGHGGFAAAVNYRVGSTPASLLLGDFNGDGKADLATANYRDDSVSVLLGNGDGTFQTAVNYKAGNSPHSVSVGDFDNDWKADLAVTNSGSGTVSILLGIGNGSFQPPVDYTVESSPVYAAIDDLNGDGTADLVVANYSDASTSVLLGDIDGTFQSPSNYQVGSNPASLGIGEFNGDGRADLVVANTGDDNVSVLLGDLAAVLGVQGGGGQSGPAGQPLPDPLVVRVVDDTGASLPGVPVSFAVTAGVATLDPSETTTGLGGTASTVVTPAAAGTIEITASVVGLPPAIFTLTATSAVPVARINPGGVVGAGLSIPPVSALSPNGIAAVFGHDFLPEGTYKAVTTADLIDGRIPTNVLGVCVLVGDEAAPIFFVAPGQINFQVPQVPLPGTVDVRVVIGCGTSKEVRTAPEFVTVQLATPEFFYFQLNADGVNPVAGYNAATYDFVGTPGMIPGVTCVPAKPGDVLTLFITGLGPTSPSFAPGVMPDATSRIIGNLQMTIGDVSLSPADIIYAGVTPNNAGLYQLNIRVPATLQSGDQPIVVSVNGINSPTGPYLPILR